MSCGIDGRLVLEHHIRDGKEIFIPLEALTVRHPSIGERVIPTGEHRFASDLASVPWPFAWLIGRTGQHLRAAIVHDWLIHALDSSNPPVRTRMAAERGWLVEPLLKRRRGEPEGGFSEEPRRARAPTPAEGSPLSAVFRARLGRRQIAIHKRPGSMR